MRIETAHEKLDFYYEKALHSPYVIHNKVAWALYQAWKEADR